MSKTDVVLTDDITTDEIITDAPKAKKPRTPRAVKRSELLVFIDKGVVTTASDTVDLVVFNFDTLAGASSDEQMDAFRAAVTIKDESLRFKTAQRLAHVVNGVN